MSSVLFVAPLLAAHLTMPAHTRELRGSGLVVRAAATESHAETTAQIEVRASGVSQKLTLERREIGAERLLASIEIVDANFDGHPDLVVLRESGAKWGAVDVFLYDVRTKRFSNASPIAHALSRLSNATFDPAHRIVTTRDIGPSNPSRVTYAIEGASLRETSSCRFLNPTDARVGTLVVSHGGASTFKTVRLGAMDVDPCGP